MFKLDGLSGVLVALASPLKKDGAVDEAGVTRLVEHVLAGGVHGLLPLGSTGETAALDAPARRQILGTVIKSAGGRVPVICGVAQSRLSSARAEVEAAASQGADAALVAPPFYYPMDQDGVLAFYRDIGDRAPVPILVYNLLQHLAAGGATLLLCRGVADQPAVRGQPPQRPQQLPDSGSPPGLCGDMNRHS